MLKNIFKKRSQVKQEMQPLDDRYLDLLFRTLLRAGNILEIQDNAQSYIDDGYQGNADIYSIIRRHITMSAQAKLVLRKRLKDGTSEIVENHELNKFLVEANPQSSMAELREAFAIYLLSTGDNFWYKPVLESGLNKGKANEIYVIPSNDIEIIQGVNSITAPINGYKLIGSTVELSGEEVYHTKYFNPNFYHNSTQFGQSPIKAAKDILSKQIEAAKTEAKQFENQGPAYLVFRKGQEAWNNMTESQKTELEKEMNSVSKRKRQGGAMVMRDEFGIERLGISPTDLRIIESTQDGRRILCNVYGMPVTLFNDPEGSTYNNVSTARKAAWTDALIPFNNLFASSLNRCLIAPVDQYIKEGVYFDMDYSSVEELQSGFKEKAEWLIKAKLSANEIRKNLGFNELEEDYMNQPIFSQGDVLGDELNLDTNLENKNHGDY